MTLQRPKSRRYSRRRVIQAGAAGAAAIVPRYVLGGRNHVAPSDRVHVALIGAGGRGRQNAMELLKLPDVRITVVADPAERWDLGKYYYKGKAGRLAVSRMIESHAAAHDRDFRVTSCIDYRRFFDRGASGIDAVLCATPDHLHAHVAVTAMRAGKHVYCEKPLTHNIAEARLVAKVARETGVATQLGNQGHSRDTMRQTVEWIRAGAIGAVREVHAWVPATRWNPTLLGPPTRSQPVPSGLEWDLWCGPRQPVGYHEAYAPVAWRDFWQFGCGAMGDFGCHDLDSSMWSLELDLPERIEMFPAGRPARGMFPHGEIGYFDFAARGDRPPVRIHWYSGGLRPRCPDALNEGNDGKPQRLPRRGVLFVGEKGVMVCGGAGGTPTIYPESLRRSFQPPPPSLPRSKGHHRDWIDAIKGGPPASSHFEYGAKLTEVTLLGVLALQLGEVVHWDGVAMKARGLDRADRLIHGSYRKGWRL